MTIPESSTAGKAVFHRIGLVSEIVDRGKALIFDIDSENFQRGFVIKIDRRLYGYRNRCPHAGSELDWVAGEFFDDDGRFLICATHGAIFDPTTGKCIKGPCVNQSLKRIPVKLDGEVVMAWY